MSVLLFPGDPGFDSPLPPAPTVREIYPGNLLGRILALDTTRRKTRDLSPATAKSSRARAIRKAKSMTEIGRTGGNLATRLV